MKKYLKKSIWVIFFLIVYSMFFLLVSSYHADSKVLKINFSINMDHSDKVEVFYAANGEDWTSNHSADKLYGEANKWERMEFDLPTNTTKIRLDPATNKGTIKIKDMTLSQTKSISLNLNSLIFNSKQSTIKTDGNQLLIDSTGGDPSIDFEMEEFKSLINQQSNSDLIIIGILSMLCAIVLTYSMRNFRENLLFFKDVYGGKELIFNLAKNDFKTKYAASYLGITWGFIQPLITILTYWFVFQVGLRSGDVSSVPFILWFIAGIIPWFFFSESVSSATGVFSEYAYLVKKVVFKIELLPIVKIVSALFVHLFFILFIYIIYSIYGHYPDFMDIQILYYLLCSVVLVFAVSIFTSSIVLFFKDLNQIITIILQIGFWFTPIGWPVTMLSNFWILIFKLNPMFYIVQGYRDTLIDDILFWQRPYNTLYFWLVCIVLIFVGIRIFKKLKPHFSDVL
ncbi:ABC transporter permease [Paenibacillus sp. PsM32]|uniref:ABC transporter permease n=1 Tax=Paenibacillus sp. PsM32 TaxID=3030536 RepID=UPI00263B2FAD|nr:ABC transporter permease [Paenibacillus sp. PsM32]MDN4620686.1 ABC transporter permease [Paenibacillus sp. PsM32]